MLIKICKGLCPLPSTLTMPVRQLNANRCAVTKVKRSRYTRQYPTLAVLPDGSTITSELTQIFHSFILVVGLDSPIFCSQIPGTSAADPISNRNGESFGRGEKEGAVYCTLFTNLEGPHSSSPNFFFLFTHIPTAPHLHSRCIC